MEIKKSRKADLEHRRPWIFAAALIGTALLFVALLETSFGLSDSPDAMDSEALEAIAQDMAPLPEDQPLVAVAEETETPVAQKINIVDTATDATDEEDNYDDLLAGEGEDIDPEDKLINDDFTTDNSTAETNDKEVIPEFPGGMSGFVTWLTENLKYPAAARKAKIEGKVTVSFIVGVDGTVSDVKIVKAVNSHLDREALRVMNSMPAWKPGEEHGKPCRTMMVVPVVFAL